MKNKILFSSIIFISICFCAFLGLNRALAATYYVDSANGNDSYTNAQAQNQSTPWKTIAKVNNSTFQPGDNILFKRGQIWREQLNPPSSGTSGNPITFGAYSSGANPKIYRSTSYSNWTQVQTSGTKKVWKGSIPNNTNYWGLFANGNRVPGYFEDVDDNPQPANMSNGYFLSTRDGNFYFRNDAGNPGTVEIGTRENAIYGNGKSYITIDSIDCFGPGGSSNNLQNYKSQASAIFLDGVTGWTIKNGEMSFGDRFGVYVMYTSSNVAINNLNVHDFGDTGIYHNAPGSIVNSKIHDIALIETDGGDRGAIGIGRSTEDIGRAKGGVTISGNEIYSIARNDRDADFAISSVDVTNAITVTRNYLHDLPAGGIQIAEGANNSVISYNIIRKYGTTTKDPGSVSEGLFAAIRIGGGGWGVTGVKALNNVIAEGALPRTASHGAISVVSSDTSNILVQNNIFFNNSNKDVYMEGQSNIHFDNNLYYKSSFTNNWFDDTNFSTLAAWQNGASMDSHSLDKNPLFNNASGTYSQPTDFKLQATSPAINAGASVSLTTDYAGTSVPQGSVPDIGAYEYTAVSPPPTYKAEDVNQDGQVNTQDIQAATNQILGTQSWPRADVNADGKYDVKDLQKIANVILGV